MNPKSGPPSDSGLCQKTIHFMTKETRNMIHPTGEDKYGNVVIEVLILVNSGFSLQFRIQININFLTVRALEYYSLEPGPHSEKARQIFIELREKSLIS